MPSLSKTTRDHDEIRRWAEERGGTPAHVKRTGSGDDIGILRIDFPGYSGEESLEPITWEQFFEKFDERNLAFLYQEETAGGQKSNFNKIISAETAEAAEEGRRGRRAGAGRGRSGARSRTKKSAGAKTASASRGGASRSAKKASGGRKTASASVKRSAGVSRKAAKAGSKTAAKKTASRGAATRGAGRKTASKKTAARRRR